MKEKDTDKVSSDVLLNINRLRTAIKTFMKPEVLKKFADLLEEIGKEGSFVERYAYFSEHSENGPDCRYARMAKHYFLEQNGDNVAELIKWLYENWAKGV